MKSIEKTLLDRLGLALINENVSPDTPLFVAFSGGPDSTALLHIISRIAAPRAWSVRALYLDHGIRTEPERACERDHVRAIARELAVPLIEGTLSPGQVEERARREGESVEMAARRLRYDFFSHSTASRKGALILLGHNRDDQVETLLMRVFRGSGPDGLAGIPRRRGPFFRPLLDTPRSEIEGYLNEVGCCWVEDRSNGLNIYERNRLRNQIIPYLSKFYPHLDKRLLALGETSAFYARCLEEAAARDLVWKAAGNSWYLERERFRRATEAERLHALYGIISRTLPQSGEVNRKRLMQALHSDRVVSGRILFKLHGMRLRVEQERVLWEKDIVGGPKRSYLIVVKGDCTVRCGKRLLSVKTPAAGDGEGRGVAAVGCVGRVDVPIAPGEAPLLIRSRRPGDLLPLPVGKKALKKIFNEWKVPEERRMEIPILETNVGIRAVFGTAWGGKDIVIRSEGPEQASCWSFAIADTNMR